MALAAWGPSWALPICSSGTLCSVVHEMGLPVSGSTQWHITGPNLCHAVTLTGMLRNKTMLKLPCCELVQTKSWIHIDKQLLSLNLTAHHAGRARLACSWASLFRNFKSVSVSLSLCSKALCFLCSSVTSDLACGRSSVCVVLFKTKFCGALNLHAN